MEDNRQTNQVEESSWLMEITEPNKLRNAVYKMKHYYITSLIEAGILQPSKNHYTSFTLSQLKYMAEKMEHRSPHE
ncbi:hypothetical protein [Halobacillus massiliensis]|uniref:hypothetical protein n=1 Tax=Halobacillus massiliensis TaxID=1926286 RepID=UPI0009E2E5F1|nr:hypothetical protein [Halobacillus massiliensis]